MGAGGSITIRRSQRVRTEFSLINAMPIRLANVFQSSRVCLRLSLAFTLASLIGPAPAAAHDDAHAHRHDDAKSGDGNPTVFTTRSSSVQLPPSREGDAFHFVIFGDRTGGVPEGLEILDQAIKDTELIDPDLVMTVGDLVQGYNQTPEWLEQAAEYKNYMNRLSMPWYPVAGNHDVYWRGPGDPPQGHHEANYEKHFGPLWYSFTHKNAGFVVMYSDEGDPQTNQKNFNNPNLQRVSDAQKKFLADALERLKSLDHVFVFLHHPRWIDARYGGSGWEDIHEMFKSAGNVHAVFAGHIHHMQYGGDRDGIAYYALGATGGALSADIPGAGYLHHFNLVTVREDSYSVAAIPVGSVIDPKRFTDAFLADVGRARSIRPMHRDGSLMIKPDGGIDGEVKYVIDNPSSRGVNVSLSLNLDDTGWETTFDHQHFELPPGKSETVTIPLRNNDASRSRLPELNLATTYRGEDVAIDLPVSRTPLPIQLNQVPANYFADNANSVLRVKDARSAVRVDSAEFDLPQGPFTLEAWVKPNRTSGYTGVVAKTQSSEYAFFYDEGLIDFSVHLSGVYVSTRSGDPISSDRMTHVAGVFDGSEIRLYVDGKLADSKAASGKRRRNKLPLWIGADPDIKGEPTRPFDGWIDEVHVTAAAKYSGDSIQPPRRIPRDDDTRLLLHFDRRYGPFDLSESPEPAKALLGVASQLVPAADAD